MTNIMPQKKALQTHRMLFFNKIGIYQRLKSVTFGTFFFNLSRLLGLVILSNCSCVKIFFNIVADFMSVCLSDSHNHKGCDYWNQIVSQMN